MRHAESGVTAGSTLNHTGQPVAIALNRKDGKSEKDRGTEKIHKGRTA